MRVEVKSVAILPDVWSIGNSIVWITAWRPIAYTVRVLRDSFMMGYSRWPSVKLIYTLIKMATI